MSSAAPSRGPRPPALVCTKCDRTIEENFANPILAYLKKNGAFHDHEPTGGWGICDNCDGKPIEEPKGPPLFIDCPVPLKDATFANYVVDAHNRAAVDACRLWLDAGRLAGKDLFLFGPTGTGKTRLAITIARALKLPARYVRVPALLRKIKEGFSGESVELQPFVDVPILILDDLGAEKPSAFTMQTLETLYTERLDADKRTILTSNLPIAERATYSRTLIDQLNDARFLSRLVGSTEVIELAGSDRRLR